jgi:PAT family beta-lactamase induction signal transducer AmpG
MNLLSSRYGRLATFFLLYITEGVPLGFSATALATAMRREGVSVEEIGLFVAALYAPWGFKWIFGPIVDLVGTRRSWILFAQVVMIVGLLGAVGIDYSANLKLFTAVMVIINTFCALQDVAIDALAVGTLKEEERGLGNGLMFAGAYVGQALGGAAMLALASRTGSMQPAFFAVAAMVGMVTIGVVLPMREPVLDRPKATLSQTSVAVAAYSRSLVRAMLLNRRSIAAAFFALLPAGAMAMGLALSTALAVELGLSDDRIAVLSLFGAITGATGSVVGGLISDRTGHRRTLAVYIALTSLPTLALAAAMQHYGWLIPVDPAAGLVPDDALLSMFWWGTLVYGFFAGLAYGTRMAIFMQICSPAVAATQFTAYMALSNLAISFSAAWQGASVERFGYPMTLGIDAVAGLACIALLPLLGAPASTEADE